MTRANHALDANDGLFVCARGLGGVSAPPRCPTGPSAWAIWLASPVFDKILIGRIERPMKSNHNLARDSAKRAGPAATTFGSVRSGHTR